MYESVTRRLRYRENLDESGFTLIELIVVILVIGILTTIAVPVVLNQRQTANEAAVKSDLINAAKVFETEFVSNNGKNYPIQMPANVKTSNGVTLSLPSETVMNKIVEVPAADKLGYALKIRFFESPTGVSFYRYFVGMDKSRILKWSADWQCSNGSSNKDMTVDVLSYIYVGYSEQLWVQNLTCDAGYTRVPGSIVISSAANNGDTAMYPQGLTSIPDANGKLAPKPTDKGFCINGTHENIAGKKFKYDSLSGGFAEGSC